MSHGSGLRVPMIDLTRQYREVKDEMDAAVSACLGSGQYILGPQVQRFEQEFADYIGVEHAVGVASGTDALFLPLKAMGIGPGDEVITTPFTFIATAEVIANCGARPVFADIEPGTFNLDASLVERAITPRTKAIILVHLFGQPADIDLLLELARGHGIQLIEDCAQATGAVYGQRKVGSFGAAGAFSFFPTKNLSCAGDGGMIVTNDGKLAESIRMLRAHGSRTKYLHEVLGINSRLDEVQAALLRVKLPRLDRWNDERIRIAGLYNQRLRGVSTPPVAPGRTHVYHQYTIRASDRDSVADSLSGAGVGRAVHYGLPLHLQPCFAHLGYEEGAFPQSEHASREVLSLPMFPSMTDEEIERVCAVTNTVQA